MFWNTKQQWKHFLLFGNKFLFILIFIFKHSVAFLWSCIRPINKPSNLCLLFCVLLLLLLLPLLSKVPVYGLPYSFYLLQIIIMIITSVPQFLSNFFLLVFLFIIYIYSPFLSVHMGDFHILVGKGRIHSLTHNHSCSLLCLPGSVSIWNFIWHFLMTCWC